jgi:O-antigen ligase
MLGSFDLDKTYQYLMISLAFLMPLTVSGANIIIVIICFLWLFSGDYKAKYNQLMSSKLMIASIVFYCLHVIGMLWTEDIQRGLHTLHKMWYFLLLYPILYTIVKKQDINLYISGFLLAIAITVVFSYLIWFQILPPFKNAMLDNPSPFMSHISYNPILAFAIYLVLHKILIVKELGKLQLFLYSFFAIAMSVNMFITGGRAGQVVYFVVLGILFFQVFSLNKIKAFLITLIVIPVIFYSAYFSNLHFQIKVDDAYNHVINYSDNKASSVGLRLSFTINSWEIIKQNPFIGVGTGDFPDEYKKINLVNNPTLPHTTNPHNMYILILVQFGLLGLVSLMSIFYYQMKFSFYASNNFFRNVGFTLPAIFLVIMLSDSYLLGHFTSLLFVFFSSFLHKNFEES